MYVDVGLIWYFSDTDIRLEWFSDADVRLVWYGTQNQTSVLYGSQMQTSGSDGSQMQTSVLHALFSYFDFRLIWFSDADVSLI